jgi:hypothetical protein
MRLSLRRFRRGLSFCAHFLRPPAVQVVRYDGDSATERSHFCHRHVTSVLYSFAIIVLGAGKQYGRESV